MYVAEVGGQQGTVHLYNIMDYWNHKTSLRGLVSPHFTDKELKTQRVTYQGHDFGSFVKSLPNPLCLTPTFFTGKKKTHTGGYEDLPVISTLRRLRQGKREFMAMSYRGGKERRGWERKKKPHSLS